MSFEMLPYRHLIPITLNLTPLDSTIWAGLSLFTLHSGGQSTYMETHLNHICPLLLVAHTICYQAT